MTKDAIAIIGMGCRFPGGVSDARALWKLLAEGREAVGEIPSDRWNMGRYYDAEPGLPGKSVARRGGFLDEIDQFDPQFFGISPREAPYVDPQQRLLLETAWEAMEDAGLVLDFGRGADIGVYVGISHSDYQAIQGTPFNHAGITAHSPIGTAHSIAANRISYCFNLRGPSVALDTACSSALTAVHAACEHIRSGRGDLALAGGVTVMITPGGFIGFSQASMLSPEGRCKAFDALADGFVRGEGAGMVLLKRLSNAIADGDTIQGVIVGTAANQDGHTNGMSLPSSSAQARLVRDACADGGVDPNDIGFVEAHGTGTAVGDPIEAHALAEALCQDRAADAPLVIGSVKTNLGHLETAAGVAGLIKAVLALRKGFIPPSLHFREPNPNIDFDALKIRVATEMEPFPASRGTRLAGVNSFGFGGANVHVLLSEPPAEAPATSADDGAGRPWPVVLSARSEGALRTAAARLAAWLQGAAAHEDGPIRLPDLTYTLGARRNHHPFRLTLVAQTLSQAEADLKGFGDGEPDGPARTAFAPRPEHSPRVAFVLSGQGPQWWAMGRELMRGEPVFRQTMERCDAAMKAADFALLEELGRSEEASQVSRTGVAQPAIFAMQMALAELWKSWGVRPAAVVGHSVGEVAAACIAGVVSLEEAARIIVMRGRFMDAFPPGVGAMLAVALDEDEARRLIVQHDPTVEVAAFNGPRALTLAGTRRSLDTIAAELEAQGTFARFVPVDYPFHHPMMEPAAVALEGALVDLKPNPEAIPLFSTVTGRRCPGEDCTARHWADGVRRAVMFGPAVEALADEGVDVWLELGAHPALTRSIQDTLAPRGTTPTVISSVRRDQEHRSMLEAAMDLHRACVPLDFAAMTPSRRLLALPAYPWDKRRWWNEAADWREGRLGVSAGGFLEHRLPRAVPTWTARLDNRQMAFLRDHRVDDLTVFPAAGFVEMVLEAGVQLFDGRAFAVEDLEIRKPLILPEAVAGVQLELSYDTAERTFAIQSKLEGATTWSVHVVGAIRGERTVSSFASSRWEAPDASGAEGAAVEAFYAHMNDLGLRYGEAFRPVRELAAGAGKSTGRVELSEPIAHRAAEYVLHPVLFDGALQVFSAAAATVEDRQAGLRLPVRFARILYLRTPGTSSLVQASVAACDDQALDGRICLYDAQGAPCVLVDGFRAVGVAGVRRGGSGAGRNIIYHSAWEGSAEGARRSHLELPPLARLRDTARGAIDTIVEARGRAALERALSDGDDLAAAYLAHGLREMARFTAAGDDYGSEALGVVEFLVPAFDRLAANLAKRGLLETTSTGYAPTPLLDAAAERASDCLRDFIREHPGNLPEGLLCAAICTELGPILRGEKDAVQVLFAGGAADLLDQVYGEGLFTSHWSAGIAAAVAAACASQPEGRGLRILEVGGGTGGLTAQVLAQIEEGQHSYTFTDISPTFFAGVGQKLGEVRNLEMKTLDLDRPGSEQGFEVEAYDLIIGANVLHAVSDLRATLRMLHTLLAPGGALIFMDVANSQLWTDTVFGMTAGWWKFTDRDLRPRHPLIGRQQWEGVLEAAGFTQAVTIPGIIGPQGEGQIGLLARKAAAASTERASTPLGKDALDPSWIIFADAGGLGDEMAERLRHAGVCCRLARRGAAFARIGADEFELRAEAPEDFDELFRACSSKDPIGRVVYAWSLESARSGVGEDPVLMGTDGLLHLSQALSIARPARPFGLDLVTRGAQPAGSEARQVQAAQAALIGLLRVIRNECPNIATRSIDLAATASDADAPALWEALTRQDAEREVALRGEARYVRRLTRGPAIAQVAWAPEIPRRLEALERGRLEAMRFAPFTEPACGPGEVLVDVKAAGMNFRDVLKALALYPGEAPDARVFGDEVAGVVRTVGSGVTHVRPGDRVFGLAASGLGSLSRARGGGIRQIPGALSFEEAATLPVVFMTAWRGLHTVARLREGETVLVHAGAGGVGMAAVQIALHRGAEVIASAGNPAKRALLRTLGVKHVIDSRQADFTEEVLALTGGRGVDVVLNALAAEAIPMGMACLAPFGRFLEIGKRDIYQNSRIPLWALRKNASFHVIAMDAVFAGDEALTRQMLAELADLVDAGALHPLPFRSFPANRVEAAFRLMASGRHIGKVVVAFAEPFLPPRGEPLAPGFEVRSDAAYLVTGGFGGFGKVIAEWLADCGARHLVLAGRSGAADPSAAALVQSLRDREVSVQVVTADVGAPADVARLMKEIADAGRPLRGVFHLAMVIDDAPIGALDRERMRAVLAPKAYGAKLLHEATLHLELDCFVMFSSVSGVVGNPAQGNYSAANAYLDALAHERWAMGLPALAVDWGVLGGEGYVARNAKVADFLARQGTKGLAPREVTALLQSFLASGTVQVMAIRVEWGQWRQFFRGMEEDPFMERIFAAVESQENGDGVEDLRTQIRSASLEALPGLILRAVKAAVGGVLRVSPDSLREDQPLTDLGLDSLMGVEIENSIESTLRVTLPPTSLLRARTIGHIGALIAEHLGGPAASEAEARLETPEPASPYDLDLEALSDDQVDALLEVS